MPRFSVDLDSVAKSLSKRSFKFSDVQNKFEKVAFDIFRKKDGNPEELWQVQNADDGNAYIVAIYNEDDEKVATASVKPDWSVIVTNADLHVFYKQEHLCKVAAAQLGLKETDLSLTKRYLPAKLAENKFLVKALLNSLDPNVSKNFLLKYPELA